MKGLNEEDKPQAPSPQPQLSPTVVAGRHGCTTVSASRSYRWFILSVQKPYYTQPPSRGPYLICYSEGRPGKQGALQLTGKVAPQRSCHLRSELIV